MADYTITDIVDAGALRQLDELANKFVTVKMNYTDLASELGKNISLPVNNFDELAKKVETYTKALEQISAKQAEMVNALNSLSAAMAQANQTTQARTRTVRESADASKQSAATDREAAIEKAKLAQKARDEKREIQLAAKEQLAYERATKDANGAEKENVRTLETLSVQYAKLKMQLSKLDVGSAEFKKLAAEAKKVHDEMNQLQMSTGNTSLNVGNYTESIQKAILGNGAFGRSVTVLTATLQSGGLKAALSSASVAIGAFGKALWALASNPYFLAITAALVAIKGLYEGVQFWYNYNEETAKAKRLTSEFLGVTDEGLQQNFAMIKAIADVYGKDYMEVLKSVDTLTQQFGVDSQYALDIIKSGFAAGADDGGEFLSMLQRYAPTFRDIGIKADELAAILAQTRSGVFNEQGLALIERAGIKLREMSSKTRADLQGIGIDVDAMQSGLVDGSLKMIDAIQMVSAKIKELPQNSEEVGNVLKDVFGKTGAQGGLKLIEIISELETNLGKVKKVTGEVGKSQEQLVDATAEFNVVLDELFGVSGTGWEVMKNQIKTAAVRIGTFLLRNLIKLYNMFVDLWNALGELRGAIVYIGGAFFVVQKVARSLITVLVKFFTGLISAAVKAGQALQSLGQLIKSVFTFDGDEISAAWDNLKSAAKNVGAAVRGAFEGAFEAAKGEISDITGMIKNISVAADWAVKTTLTHKNDKIQLSVGGGGKSNEGGDDSDDSDNQTIPKAKKNADGVAKAAKAAAKAREKANEAANKKIQQQAKEHAQYMKKIYESLSQTIIQLETDDTTKAILEIQAKYNKMKSEILGKGKTAEEKKAEKDLLMNYTTLENRELEQKIGTEGVVRMIDNHYKGLIEQVRKSQKDAEPKVKELQEKWRKEIGGLIGIADSEIGGLGDRSGKTFGITGSIKRQYEEMYASLLSAMQEGSGDWERGMRMKNANEINAFYDQWAQEINDNPEFRKVVDAWRVQIAKVNEEMIADKFTDVLAKDTSTAVNLNNEMNREIEMLIETYNLGLIEIEEFQKQKNDIEEWYAKKSVEAQKQLLLDQLNVEGISDEKRLELMQRLADLEEEINRKKIEHIEQQEQEADRKRKERVELQMEYMQQINQTIQGFGSFVNTLFQSQITELEDKGKALDEWYSSKSKEWDEAVERGAMTTEEAEARKRGAEKQTAQQKEQLEKKKREAQIKQAKWEKAMNIIDTISSTSVGIMKIWAGEGTLTTKIAMSAFVAAQGALQLATILAQKIPEYKHGTDDHKGGLAIVGDAYKSEVVLTDKGAYLTPAVPTLVDLPKHAKVLPNTDDLFNLKSFGGVVLKNLQPNVVVNVENDFKRLESQMQRNTKAIGNLQKILKAGQRNTEYIYRYGQV